MPAAMTMMNHRRIQAVIAAFTFVSCPLAQASQTTWVTLEQDAPREVAAATPLGPKASTDSLHISLALPFGDPAGIQRFVDSVSNPASPDYRHFLAPEQVGARFGLQAAAVKKVSDYLASKGMKIRLVGKNRLSILADATVAQAEAAFNVSIQDYAVKVPGVAAEAIRFSSSGPPSVPAAIGSFVHYVGGLENFIRPVPLAETPDQFRTLYSVAPLYNSGFLGQGRTVAISNWTTYGLFNIPLEYAQWNLPKPSGGFGSNVTVIPVDGSNGEVSSGAQVECDIDIQTVLWMAPLCNLLLYDNANNSDIIGVLTQEADDNKADLITESYAWNGPTPMFDAAHELHLSMSAQGITYLCASGDWGSNGMVSLYYPDEDPEVCAVGGTSVSTDTVGNRTSEVAWGGSGGGWIPNADAFNVVPSYQALPSFKQGVGVPANVPYRLVPDICLDADPGTGYEVFINGGLQSGWGGTSCASPSVAGALAACEQMIIANGGLPPDSLGHQRFGRINDLLYSFNGDPTVFYDITAGSNGSLPNGNPSNATVGWDTATGWGTPIFSGLAARILNNPPIKALTPAMSTVNAGQTATLTATISAPAGANGTTLTLSSSNACATLPATVTIAKGGTSVSFTVSSSGVAAQTKVTISASCAGVTQTATLIVDPAVVQALTISPNSVVGGNTATGTVTLSGPAGAGGESVGLASSSASAAVPSTVTVAQGASSATFPITTTGQSSATSATVSASIGSSVQSAALTITPAALSSVSVNPNPVVSGNTATGTVRLSGAAPAGGVTLQLKASKVTAPSSVVIVAGSTSATFSVTTKPVTTAATGSITATWGQQSQSTTFSVLPATLQVLSLSTTSTSGGAKVTGTATLTAPAPTGGFSLSLSSSNTKVATVPSLVRFASGSATATFTVTTLPVLSTQTVTISAKSGATTRQAALTIQPPSLISVSLSPSSVKGSATTVVTGTVTISSSAAAGVVVALKSSDPAAASPPVSVTIPAGKTTGTFRVSHKAVTVSTAVTISASLGQATAKATLTVTP